MFLDPQSAVRIIQIDESWKEGGTLLENVLWNLIKQMENEELLECLIALTTSSGVITSELKVV